MNYISTRGNSPAVSAAQAILNGLAPDGGLYIPEEIPHFTEKELASLPTLSYQKTACLILGKYLDFPAWRIRRMVRKAYSRFDNPEAVRIAPLNENLHVLELWHGPSSAFKDIALTLLPHLMTESMRTLGIKDTVHILTATSGDTGKAALVGFRDVKGTKITVFYPDGGVSPVQEAQMTTQEGQNVNVVAVHGNFDDAQTAVKALFSDHALAEQLSAQGVRLSSANSINWGRLLPQIVYYVYTAVRYPGNFAVPTGNFGDILAGYISREMGAPVGRLHCASNENNVLEDFFRTGCYDKRRPFKKTCSPSMDILVSSNLERLLYLASNGDTSFVSACMNDLKEKGFYQIDRNLLEKLQSVFTFSSCDDAATLAAIRASHDRYGYLMDPHTAVAYHGVADKPNEAWTVLATASPFKFPETVLKALGQETEGGFAALEELKALSGRPIPDNLAGLSKLPRRFTKVLNPDELSQVL